MQPAILNKVYSFYLLQSMILGVLSLLFLTRRHMLCYYGPVGRPSGFLSIRKRIRPFLFSAAVPKWAKKRNNPWRISWPLWSSRVISVVSYYLTSLVNLSFCSFGSSLWEHRPARDVRACRHRSLRFFRLFPDSFSPLEAFHFPPFFLCEGRADGSFSNSAWSFSCDRSDPYICEIRTFPL